MKKFLLAPKVNRLNPAQLSALASHVVEKLTAAATTFYPNPFPSLATVSAANASLQSAISVWGPKGNRGSKRSHIVMLAAAQDMRNLLMQLACYCQQTTLYDEVALASTGFPMKRQGHRIGTLNRVENLRQLLRATNVPMGAVKIAWDKPLDSVSVRISLYSILCSPTPDVTQAEEIALSSRASALIYPPRGQKMFYWIIPHNAAGPGAASDPLIIKLLLP